MPPTTADALVLRSYKLGETSRVVVFLTRERGKVRAVAKGSRGGRPRYQSALEPLSEVKVGLHGRQGAELLRLGACELVHSAFPAGARRLEAALFLSYLAELLDAFAQEGEAEDAVYRLALAAIHAAEIGVPDVLLARYVEAWLLKLHGVYPPLDRCAGCGTELGAKRLVYHAAAHGFVCENCGPASGPVLPEEARAVLVEFMRRAPDGLPRGLPEGVAALEGFHQMLLERHLEKVLRSHRILKDVAREIQAWPLQEIVFALERYWSDRGCLVHQPWDGEVGAGTMHPETFLRVLGPKPWRVAYLQPSRRPTDGRYGENPNRLYKHQQYQVILKPSPADVQDLYLGSLKALGIDPAAHDVRFEEDNWESPTLGAWGIGWQVLLDGQEITQFTYFQQAGGIDLAPISAEITYGLERIGMYLQDVDDVYKLRWSKDVSYGAVRHEEEFQLSRYSFEEADPELYRTLFEKSLAEGWRILKLPGGRHSLAAYDWALRASHSFNVMDARGAISVSQRAGMILNIRKLSCAVAAAFVEETTPAAPAEAARG